MPRTVATDVGVEAVREDLELERGLACAVETALLEHKRAGRAVPTLKDGEVVWITAEELLDLPSDREEDQG